MSALFLTVDELRELTGYVQAAAQIRWLRRNGIAHTVRCDGKPRVVPAALLPNAQPSKKPNFEAIRPRH